MGNLGDTKPINQLIMRWGGNEYVFAGGGGQPGPNTVGTEQIIDGAVEPEDLNEDVIERMTHSYDSENEGIKIGGFVANNSQDVGQGGGEDEDIDDDAGFDANADDGSDDI